MNGGERENSKWVQSLSETDTDLRHDPDLSRTETVGVTMIKAIYIYGKHWISVSIISRRIPPMVLLWVRLT